MKRQRFWTLGLLLLGLSLSPVVYAGNGQIRGVVLSILEELGITSDGAFAPDSSSADSVVELIDTDDDSTTEAWGVEHNSPTAGVGPRLLTMSESGQLLVGVVGVGGGTLSVPAAGLNTEKFGSGASVGGTRGTAVGHSASITGDNGVAVGAQADCYANQGTAVGHLAVANTKGTALGATSAASGVQSVSLGALSDATGQDSIACGESAQATAVSAIALGPDSASSANYAISLGGAATSSAIGAISIGRNSVADAVNCVVIGESATNNGATDCTILGDGASVVSAGFSSCTVLGSSATATKSNQMVVGADAREISEVVIGEGVTNAAPMAQLLVTTTNGVGTDIHATDLVLQSGLSTGEAVVTDIVFKTPDVLVGSSATLQTAVARLTLNETAATFTEPVISGSFIFDEATTDGVMLILDGSNELSVVEGNGVGFEDLNAKGYDAYSGGNVGARIQSSGIVSLISGGGVRWSDSATDVVAGSLDLSLHRVSAGILGIGIGAGDPAVGAIAMHVVVENVTADNTLGATETFKVLTNLGDAGVQTNTLGTVSAGYTVTFCVAVAQELRIDVQAGDKIVSAYAGIAAMADGEYATSSTLGSSITLVQMSDGDWFVTHATGTWAQETP